MHSTLRVDGDCPCLLHADDRALRIDNLPAASARGQPSTHGNVGAG